MGEKIAIGDYGEFSFTLRKKRKHPIPGESYIETGFVLRGEVIEADKSNILLKDNDDMIYIIQRTKIRHYEKLERIGTT